MGTVSSPNQSAHILPSTAKIAREKSKKSEIRNQKSEGNSKNENPKMVA
jgi:hypothetical protein